MNKNAKLIIGLACLSLGLTACKDDYFDQEKYDQRLKDYFPVGKVDPNHTWAIYGSAKAQIAIGGNENDNYTVEIYKEDPTVSKQLTVLAKGTAKGLSSLTLQFSYELASPTVYVSLYNQNHHRWTQKAVATNGGIVGLGFLGAAAPASRATRSQSDPTVPDISSPYYEAWVTIYSHSAKEPDNTNVYDDFDDSYYVEGKEAEWVVTGKTWVVDVPGHNEDIVENKWVDGKTWGWGWKGDASILFYDYDHALNRGVSETDKAWWDTNCVPFNNENWAFYGADNKEDATFKLMELLESTGRKSSWCNIWSEGTRGGYQDVVVGQQWVPEQGHYEEEGYMTDPVEAHWVYDETYVRNFKITDTWTGPISVVASEGLNNGTRTNAERTVVVSGTWNLTDNQRVGSLGKIIVAKGGKIVISKDKSLELVNQARLVVLNGGSITGEGSVMVTNGNAEGLEGYNAGTIDVYKVNNNFGKFYNYGVVKATVYAAGAQESNFYNHGIVAIKGTKEYDNYVSANARVFNACQWYCEGDMRLRNYEGTMGSSLLVDGELMMCTSEDGTQDATYVGLAAGALVKCGELQNNNTSWTGPTSNGHAVVSIGKITYLNWAQDTAPLTYGYFENNIYVEIADDTNIPLGNGDHSGETATAAYKFWSIVANGLGGQNTIRGNGGVTSVTADDTNEILPADENYSKGVAGCTPGYKGIPEVTVDESDDDQTKTSPSYRFCFEDQFPSPGDYDFNDCVITVEPTVNGTEVTVKVSLDAVGANKQIAAAMRIVGLSPNAVISGSSTFVDYAYKVPSMRYIQPCLNDKGESLLYVDPAELGKDENGNQITDFVVNLFNDAHLAMSRKDENHIDQYTHLYFYNTIDPAWGSYDLAKTEDPVEMTFHFTLNSEIEAQLFNDVTNYDVFIVERSTGRWWEVHTYPFKFDQVLEEWADYDDKLTSYINSSTRNYPWAIQVPGDFLYPVEYQSICGGVKTDGTNPEQLGHGSVAYEYFRSWAINKDSEVEEVKFWYKKQYIKDMSLVWQKPAQSAQ